MIQIENRIERPPGHRKFGEDEGLDRVAFANDGGDRFALEASPGVGKDGLIGEGGQHAKKIAAGDIPRGQDADNSRMRTLVGLEVAKFERRVVMG